MNDYYPTSEELYHLALLRFLKKNPDKAERDFLEGELSKFKEEKEKTSSPTDSYHSLDHKILEYNVWLNRLPKETHQEELVDLSPAIGTEKLIFLIELGILDFLLKEEPFKSSTRSLASALSGVTGIEATTLQSYLNPIINKSALQKNNPLTKGKKVEKIRQTLINLGFNPSK